MKKWIVSLSFALFLFVLHGQETTSPVLFTVEEDPVTVDEFLRVYNKNLDLVKDESQKDIDAYLKLFIDYKLKIKEARRLKLDEKPGYQREFANYKKQLTQNYLSDNKVTEDLIKEAYHRSIEDVKASHILIRINEEEQDTTEVYNRLMSLRDQILDEGYENVQKEVHNGKTVFAEDLGYFSAFKMVYPFESKAYSTKVGEVSLPFRTQFGFHIVYVQDRRPSLGEVTVAHIMVADNQKDSTLVPKVRINEIYRKLQQGESFESLAKQFSDDKSSSARGGVLSPFTGGQLSSQEFEDMAFSLEEPDQISEPFKTEFGWHIVKLLDKKGVPSFEESKPELEQKVRRDSRSKLINSALVERLQKQYHIKSYDEGLVYFENLIDPSYFSTNWKKPDVVDSTKVVLTIKDQDYRYSDFMSHLAQAQRSYSSKKLPVEVLIEREYKTFLEKSLLTYHEEHLEFENPEFGFVVNEYREGLLLFDLMEQEVWNAASKDSVGLRAFYEKNKQNYRWLERLKGTMYTSASKDILSKVEKRLQASVGVDNILEEFNSDTQQNIIVTNLSIEADDDALPNNFKFQTGISEIYSHNGAYHIIDVDEVLPESTKALEDTRGSVVSDYQTKIENDWLAELHSRYKVSINQKVLNQVKSKLKS